MSVIDKAYEIFYIRISSQKIRQVTISIIFKKRSFHWEIKSPKVNIQDQNRTTLIKMDLDQKTTMQAIMKS